MDFELVLRPPIETAAPYRANARYLSVFPATSLMRTSMAIGGYGGASNRKGGASRWCRLSVSRFQWRLFLGLNSKFCA